MHQIKGRIKKSINKIGKKALIRGCHAWIVNDDIIVALDMTLGKAENLIIDNIKYKAVNNSVRLPYNDKIMDALLNRGMIADYVLGMSKSKIFVSGAQCKEEGEKLLIDDDKYEYNYEELVRISDFTNDDQVISFSPKIVAGRNEALTFAAVDGAFRLLDESMWDPKDGVHVTLRGIQTPESKIDVQLVAFRNGEAIPLVAGNRIKTDGLIIRQTHNRVCIEKDGDDAFSFEAIEKINIEKLASVSKVVSFSLDHEGNELFLKLKAKREDSIILMWQDLRTGKDTEIAVIDNSEQGSISLVQEMKRHIAPYERYALRYKLIKKGKISEKGFVYVEESSSRLFSNNVILSCNGNMITRMVNGTLILECEDSCLSYQEKYSYDFSSCGFSAQAHNVRLEGASLCFDLRLQSALLSISSAEVYVKDSNKKAEHFVEAVIFDTPQLTKEISVRVDPDGFSGLPDSEERFSLWVGIRYANGYAESDIIFVTPEEFAKGSAAESLFWNRVTDKENLK